MKNKLFVVLQIIAIAAAGHFIAYEICHVPKQIELVTIFAIALLYPILRFPLIGVYAIFLISPFIPFIRRLYYIAHGRPGIDPLIVVGDILTLMVFVGLFFELREPRPGSSFPKTAIRIISVYILYMIFRTFVFNILPLSESLGKLRFYAPAVLLFFVGIVYAKDFGHLKRLWALTVGVGLIACLYGLKQLYVGYSGAERLWFSSINFTTLFIKGIARPFSIYQAPAAFADYLLIGIVGVLILLSIGKMKSRIILVVLLPLFFYGILITSVRSNWIGAVAVFFFWFVVLQIKNNGRRIVVIVGAVLLFLSYQFVDDAIKSDIGLEGVNDLVGGKLGKQEYLDLMVTSRTRAITNPFEEHSMLSRMALWNYMFQLSIEPEMAVLGRGLGALNADSLYVTYLAEFGYPGFFFIIGIFCVFIVRGINVMRTLSDPRAIVIAKGIVCMDMSFALMNLTGTHIHSFPGDVYFWFWNGVLMSIQTMDAALTQQPVDL
jgi:hypothetical protein